MLPLAVAWFLALWCLDGAWRGVLGRASSVGVGDGGTVGCVRVGSVPIL